MARATESKPGPRFPDEAGAAADPTAGDEALWDGDMGSEATPFLADAVAAPGTIAVVEEEPRRIVAAVDGSPNSRTALVRAAEEARGHDGILHVLYAWNYLDQAHLERFDVGYGEAEARQWLEALVEETLPDRPEGTLVTVVNDHAARALIDASEGAWTVVIGSRGLGGFRGLLLGSVSQQVVHHARCAVLVVPGPADED